MIVCCEDEYTSGAYQAAKPVLEHTTVHYIIVGRLSFRNRSKGGRNSNFF